MWSTNAVQCVSYLPLRSCDLLGIGLVKNCNIFNFDEVLVSSFTPLHPPRFVADGFDDYGTKSHTSSLAFLGCFSRTNPKMFFLTILHIAKDLSIETENYSEKLKSLLCAMTFCSLQEFLSQLSPDSDHQCLHYNIQTYFWLCAFPEVHGWK